MVSKLNTNDVLSTDSLGMSYDVDHSTSGTVYEYNISHDNEGGFILLCPYEKPTRNFTIRYNLSINDRTRTVQICSGELERGQIYKNTIYIGDGISPMIVTENTNANLDILFSDNIIRKEGSGTAYWSLIDRAFNVTNNAFHGSIAGHPGVTNTIKGEPGLAAPGLRDPKAYLLLSGYSACDSAISIPGDASRDFFSNPTAKHNNIGLYAGEGTKKPAWFDNFDQSSLSNEWSTQGTAGIVTDPAGDHGKSAQLKSMATISRKLDMEAPFRFNARVWVNSPTSKRPLLVQVGKVKVNFSSSSSKVLAGEWQTLEITVANNSVKVTLDGELFTSSNSDGSDTVFNVCGRCLCHTTINNESEDSKINQLKLVKIKMYCTKRCTLV